jgi:MFS family permease
MSHLNSQHEQTSTAAHGQDPFQTESRAEPSDRLSVSSHSSHNPTTDRFNEPPLPSASANSQQNNAKQEPLSDLEKTAECLAPDGGARAWLVCFGTFCAFTSSFGWLNSVGVFQAYYQNHFLQSYSSSTISWISSVQVFIIFGGGIIFGKLFDDNGPRWLLISGTSLQVLGLLMTAQSTKFYQFFLAQALCSSTGASCIYYASAGAISTWFLKKRATAFGIAAMGASIGGVFFPIMVTRLVNQIGFPWTMRAVALIVLALNIVATLTVKSLLVHTRNAFSPQKYLRQFEDVSFVILLSGMTIFSLGLWLPINFLITYGKAVGISVGLSQYLIPVLNAARYVVNTIHDSTMLLTSILVFLVDSYQAS